ncbi:MAG: glycosyltransferase [Planctomycetes bacterium]|nr:glycosyltransferase [Planctomycetota bacterium]
MAEELAIRAAGGDAAAGSATAEVLSRGLLAWTFAVRSECSERIVKLFSPQVAEFFERDPDPRVRTFGRLFPIAPFFSTTARWSLPADGLAPVRVAEVLDEGVLDGCVSFVVMTRLSGDRWRPRAWRSASARRRGSRALGALTRRLHGADLVASDAPRFEPNAWLDRVGELLFLVCDQIQAAVPKGAGSVARLHGRVHAVLELARTMPLGGEVLVHGDCHPANLLFDERGEVSGMVDFELMCLGPAALDFRHLSKLDAAAFLSGYGGYDGGLEEACWLGHFMDLLWEGLGLLAQLRIRGDAMSGAVRRRLAQWLYLLRLCERKELRRGPAWRRRLRRLAIRFGLTLERASRPLRLSRSEPAASTPVSTAARVAVIVPTWNQWQTTTRPCLRSLLWFTDMPYRVIFVDNGSVDDTRTALRRAAAGDPRVEVAFADRNLGWAGGSLLGLDRVHATDTHVLLLNSDTMVTPRWLAKLLGHLVSGPAGTVVIPDEYPQESGAVGPAAPEAAIVPGTVFAAPPPALGCVLDLSARVEQRHWRIARPGPPSGFCALFDVAQVSRVRQYLADFDRYHAGELDPIEAWRSSGLRSLVAMDTFVFHARGGSGGYYRYDRARAL